MIKLEFGWEQALIKAHKGGQPDQWDTYLRRTLKGRINEIHKLIKEGKAVVKKQED